MRKLFLAAILLLLVLSCRDGIVNYPEESKTGTLLINSSPRGAEIYFESNYTGKVTPDSLIYLQPGSYSVRLHLVGYPDKSFYVNVVSGQKRYINTTFNGY